MPRVAIDQAVSVFVNGSTGSNVRFPVATKTANSGSDTATKTPHRYRSEIERCEGSTEGGLCQSALSQRCVDADPQIPAMVGPRQDPTRGCCPK